MSAIILYRQADTSNDELEAIDEFFPSTFMRTAVPHRIGNEPEWLVIGRYSVLPYYNELVKDLRFRYASLVNNYEQHQFLADLGQWYEVLKDITPRTWGSGFDVLPENKSFVLKGQTNSKKFNWNTHMFAKDKESVRVVLSRLLDDTLIGRQDIYVREYVPLVTYCHGINGLPITKEFRFFVLYGEVLCGGFYWSSHIEEVTKANGGKLPSAEEVPQDLLEIVTTKLGHIPFYSVDIAQTITGDWTVVDLNDGQMSGLSEISPRALYMSMYHALSKRDLI